MINTKRPSTDNYTQVGFVEAKDTQGNYRNIDHIYDSQGNIVFQQGYLNEYQGADNFSIPAIGKPLLDYTIYGNTVQSGTPTPDNPIMPQSCGERTGNLCDDDNAEFGKWVNSDGSIRTNATYAAGYDITVGTTSEFAVKYYGNKPYSYSMAFYDSNGNFLTRVHQTNPSASYNTFPVPENAVSARFQVAVNTSVVMTREILKAMKLMLNLGSTALPYEPYGYKIPISSANTTTPVYLGEVQTTRKAKKLVLTGKENITMPATSSFQILGVIQWGSINGFCTHYQQITWDEATYVTKDGFAMRASSGGGADRFRICDLSITTIADFKSYLAQQYAAGTPVTVWYVLANEETAVVNEPLMKIGTYVDTVSMEQAGVSIPTLNKPNITVIDVETEVEPSEVDVTYRGSTKPKYDLFLAQNGDSFEAKDGQSLYIGGDL